MHRILNYACRREMVICSAWRIEHHCAQTVMFQPTWEASMHHHTNGFWILASKSLFTLQLTTTTTTQASIAEIQAYQCQKLISISLPTMRSGQQWQWKLKLDPQKLGDRLDPNYFCVYVFGAAFFPFFFFCSAAIVDFVNCKQCIHALFTIPQITFFSNFFTKNGS